MQKYTKKPKAQNFRHFFCNFAPETKLEKYIMAQYTNTSCEIKSIVKTFEELTTSELYEILKVRAAVFVVEQEICYQDMDDIDFRATHVALWHGNQIVAYSRVFKDDEPDAWHIGRVLTTQRNKKYGLQVMEEAIKVAKNLGGKMIKIEAQSYATGFYEKVGFQICSEEFLLDGILHKKMKLQM